MIGNKKVSPAVPGNRGRKRGRKEGGKEEGREAGTCCNFGAQDPNEHQFSEPLTCPAHEEGFGWPYIANTIW